MSYKFYETLERCSKYTHYVTLHIAETIDMDVSIDYSRVSFYSKRRHAWREQLS